MASELGLPYEANPRVRGEDDEVSHTGPWRPCDTRGKRKEQRKRTLKMIPLLCFSVSSFPRRLCYLYFSIQGNCENMFQNYVYVGGSVWKYSA